MFNLWMSEEFEEFDETAINNHALMESIPDEAIKSPLDHIIFLEELKAVGNAMAVLSQKECDIVMMRNYDGITFKKIRDYFSTEKNEELSDYIVRRLEKRAVSKIRQGLKFTDIWS